MTAALYELLCQAYAYVNSPAYRGASGDAARAREIRTLSLSFPSGITQAEYQRFAAQARKAIAIFARTLGKNQRVVPELNLSIDEASAVHSDLHLERTADAGARPAAVVRLVAAGPGDDEIGRARAAARPGRRARRPPPHAFGRSREGTGLGRCPAGPGRGHGNLRRRRE